MKACTQELSGKTLAPPPQFTLNKSNIHLYEKGSSQLAIFKVKKFGLLGFDMHDGITKFGMEFNGIFLCGVDKDTFLPFSFP